MSTSWASYIICGSLIFVETVRRESLICTGNHKLERWKHKAHMGIMIGYILLVNLIPQILYHMLLSYPPTISSKSTYSFLIRMDWSKVLNSKSHQIFGWAWSSHQIMGSNVQPIDTLNDLLLSLPFNLGSWEIITIMGITMQIWSIFDGATCLVCMI